MIAQDRVTDPLDHGPVPFQERRERQLVAPGYEHLQQMPVAHPGDRPGLEEKAKVTSHRGVIRIAHGRVSGTPNFPRVVRSRRPFVRIFSTITEIAGPLALDTIWGYTREEEVRPMKTITIEVPDEMTSLGGGTDEELAASMRLATAILWYQQGRISQGKAAEIAGMNRVVFLNALYEAGVEAIQVTEEELRREMELPTRTDR
jgi:predicted HTH domain antitoxin